MKNMCFVCNMRLGIVSNYPEFGSYTCEWCYLKSIHSAKYIMNILKNKLMFHSLYRKAMSGD